MRILKRTENAESPRVAGETSHHGSSLPRGGSRGAAPASSGPGMAGTIPSSGSPAVSPRGQDPGRLPASPAHPWPLPSESGRWGTAAALVPGGCPLSSNGPSRTPQRQRAGILAPGRRDRGGDPCTPPAPAGLSAVPTPALLMAAPHCTPPQPCLSHSLGGPTLSLERLPPGRFSQPTHCH